MISKFMFDAVYKRREFLTIEPYEVSNHVANFYYFRVGAQEESGKVIPIDTKLIIPKNGFVKVWSLEQFTLGERILGLFGNLSEFIDKGLQLVNSPSIDPGFNGSLVLGIKNNLDRPAVLKVGDRIGKILFFDVSDTFINAEEFLQNVLKQQELNNRREAAETIAKTVYDVMLKSNH
ncbi:MAG TPA: hypothetical protein VJU84_16225 [Pyrinomonadaceae bacterium]|nr:hypothetical protein [Pyrinomonadaceae bacterium]